MRHATPALLLGLLACGFQQKSPPVEPKVEDPTPDTTAPVIPGGLSIWSVRHTTLRVSWPRAVDNRTAPDELAYKVVRAATAEAIDTVAEADGATDGLVLDWTPNVWVHTVTGLSDSTRYAFAVLVRDAAGNKALYPPATALTADGRAPTPGAAPSFMDLAASAATVSWGAASDGVARPEELQYKVVWAAEATPLASVAQAEALPAAQVALDWTVGVTSTRINGLSDVARTHVGVLVRDPAGYKAAYTPAAPINFALGRLADWPLDGNASDLSGARPPGVVTGAAPTEDRKGQAGKAYAFDGVSSAIDLGPASISGLGRAATISLWVRPERVPLDANYFDLFAKARVFTVALWGAGGKARVRLHTGNGVLWDPAVESTGEVAAGAWSHLVVTFDAGVVTFYVNGAAAGTGSAARATLGAANACPLTMGVKLETSDPMCSALNPENYFPGALDDVRVFGRVLTPTEIAALYHERGF